MRGKLTSNTTLVALGCISLQILCSP
uniref:Uncharacterized protein n=1 Tax=Anguilla anguilla TaxID=7936 RepID=A0A0E9XG87_ANGAN